MFENFDINNLFTEDPQKLGLLVAGLQMLQGAPNSRKNFGNDLSHGLLAGVGAAGAARNSAQERELRKLQIDQARRAAQEDQDIRAAGDRAFAPAMNTPPDPREFDQMGPGSPMPAPFTRPGGGGLPQLAQDMLRINPTKGVAFQQALAKESHFDKASPKDYEPESLRAFQQSIAAGRPDYSLLTPREKVEVSSGIAYNPYHTKPGAFITGPESDVIPDGKGGWMPNPAKLMLRQAGATKVSLDTAEKPFVADFGKEQAKSFFKMRDSATKAADSLQGVNNMREAIANGAWQGGGSNIKASIANYLKPMGFSVDEEKLKGTTLLNVGAGNFLMQHAKDLGANPSNADAARLDKIIGSAETDPKAMDRMLDWQEEMYRKTIRNYSKTYEQVKKNPHVFNAWDMSVEEPAPFSSPAGNTPTIRYDKNGKRLP